MGATDQCKCPRPKAHSDGLCTYCGGVMRDDHTIEQCKNKFDNTDAFGREPFFKPDHPIVQAMLPPWNKP